MDWMKNGKDRKKRFEKRKVNGMEKTRGMERREEKRKNIFKKNKKRRSLKEAT